MKAFILIANVVALLTSSVAGNSIAEAQALYPACALTCLGELVPKSECGLTNQTCLCTNVPLNKEIAACIKGGCIVRDQLRAENASKTLCDPSPPRDQRATVIAGGVVPGALAFVVFIARMLALFTSDARTPSWEDWTMCGMVAFTIPPTIFAVTLANHGLGTDIWTLDHDDITMVLKYYYFGEIFYILALTMFKISLLCFILRIFPTKHLRIGAYIGLALSVAYGIAFFFATLFQCSPVSMAWNFWDEESPGRCNDIKMQAWMLAGINIVLDVYILILPLHEVWKLKMNTAKKFMLVFMFSLGIFVTLTSVLRLRTLLHFASSHNFTWDYVEAATWSTVELHVGIITASLPSLRSLFVSLGAKMLASTKGTGLDSSGFGTSTNGRRTPHGMLNRGKLSFLPRSDTESGSGFIGLVDVEAKHEKSYETVTHDHGGIVVKSGITIENQGRYNRY